ncbi:hypothetical protein E6R60_26760 [Streptomyces sp. A0642]|uniref:hypothetical protein n=1 Tax=Streptomyces sp. A0642 TaxID=2563100 RepID=UPI0010A28E4F|nr:hypothetical protein [Streptomyces sp. A0642]THA72532.1 hypothetical protein E6R60_26760 [Streptomyces sp. A0642]
MNIAVQIEEVTLATVVAEALTYDSDEGEMVPTGEDITVGCLVAQEIVKRVVKDDQYPRLREQVTQLRAGLIREKLGPMIDEALQGKLRKTNNYGEAVGPEITFREMVVEEVRKALNESPNNYGSQKGTTLQIAVRAEVKKAAASAVAEQLASMGDLIRQQVNEAMSEEAIAAAIASVSRQP